jgi:hypothetical protein
MTTDDDNNSSNNNKKGKTAAAVPPSSPTSPNSYGRLASLPDAVISSVSEFTTTSSLLRLSETSKDLRDAFGCPLSDVKLFWHGDESSPSSLLRFLRRQQQVKTLTLGASDFLPILSSALVEKPMPFLHTLDFFSRKGTKRSAKQMRLPYVMLLKSTPCLHWRY